jgi:hypothetical protein
LPLILLIVMFQSGENILMGESCIIFDLDGTVCDVSHRQHFIKTKPRNWDAWNAGILQDKVNLPVVMIFKSLQLTYKNLKLIILTGRSDDYKNETQLWLNKHDLKYDELYMRKCGDHRDDTEVKGELVDIIESKYNILCVFEDRKRVVDMWVERGVWVFDCGQTKGDF